MEEQFETTTAKSELSKLSIKDLFYKYVRFLPLFIVSVALALLVAYLFLRYSTPVYQSDGSMMIRNEKKGSGDRLEELMTANNEVNLQNEVEQLKSRPIMERVVQDLDLNVSYASKGKVKQTDIYKSAPFKLEIFSLADSSASFTLNIKFNNAHSFRINEEGALLSFGQVFKNAFGVFRLVKKEGIIGEEYVLNYQPTATLANNLSSALLVVPKGNTNILLLSLQATHPQFAADVINQLMNEYRFYSVEEKNETIEQQITFINTRIKVVDKELDSITAGLLAYRRANNLIDVEAQSGEYFSRIQESDRELNQRQAELELLGMIDSYLRNRQNNYSTTPTTLGIADPTLATLISAYNVAQLERKALIDKNVPVTNPMVEAKESQIEKLRQNILENIRNIRGSLAGSIGDLRRENSSAQGQVRALPEKQQRLVEMERQQATKLAVYNILLEQKERSAITLAATTSNVRVVQGAGPNFTPVKPNPTSVQLMAIVIGLLLPALIIFGMEMLNDKVTTRADIEKITDATIIGEVGHSYSGENLVVSANNRSVVAEQFRIIRSNLQYVLNHIEKPVILVSSSFSGEGKSFISTNMGAVMALTGKKTIILEFDIRKPKVLSHLGMSKKPGLTNYLLGKAEASSLPVPVPGQENLYVLACGPVPPNPSEMLLDSKIKDLFDYLRSEFDVIVMDTAPVGMVSDALTLSRYADATLYIVRQGRTYKKQIGLIDEFYREGKLPKISLVLNDVKMTSGYGYYGYGRYGYGYGSGYFDDEGDRPPGAMQRWFGWMGLNGQSKKHKKRKERV